MGVPWPSRFHLGSDLAQTFYAGQSSRCHLSCAAHGAQVRLVMLTHRALGITAPSAIKMQPCQRAAAQQQVSQLWPLPRGTWVVLAQGEVAMPSQRHMCQVWGRISRCLVPKCLGSWPGLIYYLCPSSYSPKATGSKPQG